jgi:hypothetical protein
MPNDVRPARYSANESRFNLMAVIKDRKLIFEEQIEELLRSKEVCCARGRQLERLVAKESLRPVHFKRKKKCCRNGCCCCTEAPHALCRCMHD